MYKGVIFDLDGTLVDSIEDLALAMNEVLQQHDFPTHPIAAYKTFIGNGMNKLAERALPKEYQNIATLDHYASALKEAYKVYCNTHTKAYDGIGNLLTTLQVMGIHMGVLSNKMHNFTQKVVLTAFPDIKFTAVHGMYDEATKKPNPMRALEMAKEMKLPVEQVLFVGDSDVDIQTARNAGMRAVSVTWGFQPKEKLVANHPDFMIDVPEALLGIIKA